MKTREKLASELRAVAAKASPANAAKYEAFTKRADTGEFDDYADTYVCPITQLYSELTAAGFTNTMIPSKASIPIGTRTSSTMIATRFVISCMQALAFG